MRQSQSYRPELDGLRAIAATAVVLFHAHVPLIRGGLRGVDVFFVLSGYLITGILAASEFCPLDFWRRRLKRLLPALAAFLAAYVALSPSLLPKYAPTRWIDAAFAGAYISDQATARGWQRGLGHTWSLAVEMQFYVLWPFIVAGMKRLSRRSAATLLWGVWAVITMARAAHYLPARDWVSTYYPGYYHCSGLVLGAALFFCPLPTRFGLVGAAALVALIIGPPSDGWCGAITWAIPLTELATAAVICSLAPQTALASFLSWPPLVGLGVLSYGVYLWHHPLTQILEPAGWQIAAPASLALAIALSAISFATVEAHFRRPRFPRATSQELLSAHSSGG